MCLAIVYSKKRTTQLVKDLEAREDGYIWLWKVFEVDVDDNLVAQFHDYSFYEGKNTAKGKVALKLNGTASSYQYEPGFHCFEDYEDACYWERNSEGICDKIVVPIKVRKSWITSAGWQERPVFVCKHIII